MSLGEPMNETGRHYEDKEKEDLFPWHLGLFDAHCHPTDTIASLALVPDMKTRVLTVMATRPEDQDLVVKTATDIGIANLQNLATGDRTQRVIPSFGWHPWFSHKLYDDTNAASSSSGDLPSNVSHYGNVLSGDTHSDATSSDANASFMESLPAPTRLSAFLQETEKRLRAHPYALVGEVGLDRAFRIPNDWLPEELANRDPGMTPGSREGRRLSPYRVKLGHQKAILKAQLRLAGKMRRAVSVHSVHSHGAVLEVFEELWKGSKRKVLSHREKRMTEEEIERTVIGDGEEDYDEEKKYNENGEKSDKEADQEPSQEQPLPFPPRVCMHSYSGPPDPLRQFLHPAVPTDIFFSFSHVINFDGTESSLRRVESVIRTLPEDRILVESDVHCAGERMDELLEQAVRRICGIRGWGLEKGIKILGSNWRRFVFGKEEYG